MPMINLTINPDTVDLSFYKRNILLFDFMQYKDISNGIKILKQRSNEKDNNILALKLIGYLSLFTRDECIEYDKYHEYISKCVDNICTECNISLNDIEKNGIVLSIIILTSNKYTSDSIDVKNSSVSTFAEIDLSNPINVWSMLHIGDYYLKYISEWNNFNLFKKLLSSVSKAREQFDYIDQIVPHYNYESIWSELKKYEVLQDTN